MNALMPVALLLTASAATSVNERPIWAGRFDDLSLQFVLSASPTGLTARSDEASATLAAVTPGHLTPGLCTGANPRLGVPADGALLLLEPGSPARLKASVALPAAAASAAVPVTSAAGCQLAVVLASGDVALVGPAGELNLLAGVIPAPADLREFPRGLLVASRGDLLVVGTALPQVSSVKVSDNSRFTAALPTPAVPGAAWSSTDGALWFLSRSGLLHAWVPGATAAVGVALGNASAPGGLVVWGGRVDHGLAWADLDGQVYAFRDSKLLALERLPRGVVWPLLSVDLDDSGDQQLVAALDAALVAVVSDQDGLASFRLEELSGRSGGPPVVHQLSLHAPPVLAVPLTTTKASASPRADVASGPMLRPGTTPVAGVQLAVGQAGTPTAALPAAASFLPAAPTKKSGCTTGPGADGLALLLASLALLLPRRRATAPASTR